MGTAHLVHIGDVARRARVSPDTVRHYERKGLLPRAPRSPGGYRLFDAEAGRRVQMVQAALSLGFTLDELASVLRERARGRAPCHLVRALAEEKLRALEAEMARLAELRDALVSTLAEWDERLARTPPGHAAGLLESFAERLGRPESRRRRLPSPQLRGAPP
jgi:DNA-binding transcriptional MerR regulator